MPRKKSKKKNSLVIDWLLYLALRILGVFLYLFDVETNLNTACFLGRLLWKYYHRGRKRALDNLRVSFPEKSEQWIWQTGRRSFEHIAMLAIDVLFTPRLVKKYNWRDYSRYKNVERVKWLMQEGNGLLTVTGHYGNFEIIGYLLGLFGFNIYSIARPLDNSFISNYLYSVRQRAGQKIIDKKGAAELMGKISSGGATLCFIADQDAGRKGVFVDFFGRKASTYKSIGLLAITNNLPIVVGYSRRVDNRFYFEVGSNRIISPKNGLKRTIRSPGLLQNTPKQLSSSYDKTPANTGGCTADGSIGQEKRGKSSRKNKSFLFSHQYHPVQAKLDL